METKQDNQGVGKKVWSFFSSITLAVSVFSAISLTSIIGTIIEQQAEPAHTIRFLAKFFNERTAHSAFRALDAMGFTDMFNSWWFLALLVLFAANLVICSIDRLPGTWKRIQEPIRPLNEEQLRDLAPKRELVVQDDIERSGQKAQQALHAIGFRGAVQTGPGTTQVCAEKGRYSRLGVYVTHLSILLILIGAVIGMRFGFTGFLNLREGSSSGAAFQGGGQKVPLGFELRCDDFEVSFYPDSERPKEYKSLVTVMEQGKELFTTEIAVNSPLRYKGITFYQSSYGFAPHKGALFKFTVTPSNGKTEHIAAQFEQTFMVPGTRLKGRVADFSPALGMDKSGRLITFSDSMVNPAMLVEFFEGGKPAFTQWIMKRYPETWQTPIGTIEFHDLWGAQYTGLQVRKDPGVWLVYLGCLLMAVGLYAAFFTAHTRIWIRLKAEQNGTRLLLAAARNKNRAALDTMLDNLVKQIEQKP